MGFAILEAVLREGKAVHRDNLVGRSFQQGYIEMKMNRSFSDDERELGYSVFDDLVRSGLLRRPRTQAIGSSDEWVDVSEAAREAIKRRTLDDLDGALFAVDPRFVGMREGMWSTFHSGQPERNRQAAHSARELINQILHELAPELRGDQHTRKARVKATMKKRGKPSDSDCKLIESFAVCIDCLYAKLSAEAHTRGSDTDRDIRDLITMTELALRRMLI